MIATLYRLSTLLALAALLSACAAPQPGAHYAAPAAGTTYVSERRDTGSYGNGMSEVRGRVVGREWKGQPAIGFENAQNTLLLSAEGHYIGVAAPDGTMIMTWSPPISHFPLQVGRRTTSQSRLEYPDQNRVVPFEATATVEAYENVTVPAGTFAAFRVRTVDTLGNDNVEWYAPEVGMLVKSSLRRTERNSQGAGTREAQIKAFTRPSS